MPARERRLERGEAQARRLSADAGRELRLARMQHGLSLARVGEGVGLSASAVSRIERGLVPGVSVRELARLAGVLGLDLALRLHPQGEPLRDRAHIELLARLRRRLHPGLKFGLEVPLPRPGDRRAWDGLIRGPGWLAGVEAETRPVDLQALLRRVALKERDGGADLVVLLLAATRYNQRLVRGHAAELATTFPVPGTRVVEYLAAGVRPPGGGVVLL